MKKLKIYKVEVSNECHYVGANNKKETEDILLKSGVIESDDEITVTLLNKDEMNQTINMQYLGEMSFTQIVTWLNNPMHIYSREVEE